MTHLNVLSTTATTSTLVVCECSIVICSVIVVIPFYGYQNSVHINLLKSPKDFSFTKKIKTIPVIIIVVITLCAANLNDSTANAQTARQPTNEKSGSVNESVSSCLSNATSVTLKKRLSQVIRFLPELLLTYSVRHQPFHQKHKSLERQQLRSMKQRFLCKEQRFQSRWPQ